jgi:hypothetical protein
MGTAEKERYQADRQKTFQAVPDKSHKSGLQPDGPENIRRPGIAASEIADVETAAFTDKITGLKQSENIADQQTYHSDHNSASSA